MEKAVYFWFPTNILTSCLNIQTLLSHRPDSQCCCCSFPLPLQASLPIMTLQIFILLRRLLVNVRRKSQVQIHRGEKHFGRRRIAARRSWEIASDSGCVSRDRFVLHRKLETITKFKKNHLLTYSSQNDKGSIHAA